MKSGKRKERPFEEDEEYLSTKPSKQTSTIQKGRPQFSIHEISGDGNCLFRCILYALYGADDHHQNLRGTICKYILEHKHRYSEYFEGLEDALKKQMEEMKINGVWGTHVELYAASELFAFNFQVYRSNNMDIYCSCIHSEEFPTIYLQYLNGNHFNLLFEKNNSTLLSKNNKKKQKSFKSLLKETIDTTSKYIFKTEENLKNLKKQEKLQHPISIEIKKQVKKTHRTTYPPGRNNSNSYNEIFQYFTIKKIPERFLPIALHQKRFNNWAKDIRKCYSLDKISRNRYSLSRL